MPAVPVNYKPKLVIILYVILTHEISNTGMYTFGRRLIGIPRKNLNVDVWSPKFFLDGRKVD